MTGRAESRLGFDSARSVQPETPERNQRENATSVPTPSPKLCHFRLTLTRPPLWANTNPQVRTIEGGGSASSSTACTPSR